MRHTINYTRYRDLHGEEAAHRKAIIDVLQFIGHRRYKILIRELKKTCMTFEVFCFCLSFCGVEGYPALAIWDRYTHGHDKKK